MALFLDGVTVRTGRRRPTRRERFFALMGQLVPWAPLVAVLDSQDAADDARPPLDTERMLRLYFVQRWYALTDEALDDALHDMESLRRFTGVDPRVERLPDGAEALAFRRRLESSREARALLAEIDTHLGSQGLRVHPGAIVEATIAAWSVVPRAPARRGRGNGGGEGGA